jgi:SAM-dependent methyltransferase
MQNKREEADKRLFDEIAVNYVKKDLIPYCRLARKQRLVRSLLNIQQPIKNLLEVGCGAGFTANYLKSKYIDYTGVDYSENLINYAKEHNSMAGVRFECTNINDFSSNKKYDVILMIGVLHHIPEPENAIRSLSRLLSPKGVIVVNEPQHGNPIIGLLRKLRKRVDDNYSSDQVEFTVDEIRSIFEISGYKVTTYSQGVLSTPLAESRILPVIIGVPLVWLAVFLDPILEKLFAFSILKKLTWNIVAQAELKKF